MRIGMIVISPVAFYSEPVWNISYAYRVFLIAWRIAELSFVTTRYLFLRAPFLLVWTRLPVTKNIILPRRYRTLQSILAPDRETKLAVAGGRAGSITMKFLDQYRSAEDIRKEQEFLRSVVRAPSPIKVAIGGVVRGLITELGSLFIKLAQILSMRPELPPFLREELASVQDKLPGLPEDEVKHVLERELMKPVEEIFEWVDYKPIAAASLAIVHRAKLRSGEEVALKIQRPFLQGIVALDTLIILKILLGTATRLLPRLGKSDLTFFTLSFESALRREINFELEGHIQEHSREALLEGELTSQCMHIAKVYFEYTTTKLLTMEFVHNLIRVDELFDKASPEEIWELISMKVPGFPDDVPAPPVVVGCRFPMHMQWQGEVFHGDLHLGNLYLKKPASGENWKIFLCDFGMFENIPREEFRHGQFFLWGLLAGIPDMAMDGLKAIHVDAGGKLTEVDWPVIEDELSNFFRAWVEPAPEEESGVKLRRSKLHEGGYTRQLLAVLYGKILSGGLRLPYWMWLFLKGYLYLEETGTSIMGGSYDWNGWILDQYAVRVEKDAVLSLFDNANVFTTDRALERLEVALPRGTDYPKVLKGTLGLLDDGETKQSGSIAQGGRR